MHCNYFKVCKKQNLYPLIPAPLIWKLDVSTDDDISIQVEGGRREGPSLP